MKNIYISGSISDGGTLSPEDQLKRIEMFFYAENLLTAVGFDVLNPARHGSGEEGRTWLDYMRLALIDIASADMIATLPGWEVSAGAQIEVTLARGLGLPIASYDQWVALQRPDPPIEPPKEETPVEADPPSARGTNVTVVLAAPQDSEAGEPQ